MLLVTDPGVAATGHPGRIADAMRRRGLEVTIYDRARVEPTDASLEEAIAFARDGGPFDAIVAVGGGSAIDTAKAVNLLVTNDGELMDYVNAPVGAGRAPARRCCRSSPCRRPPAPARSRPPSACSTCWR